MAIKRTVTFKLNFRGDGVSTVVRYLFADAPFWFSPPSSGDSLQPTFDLTSKPPLDVADVVVTSGLQVASAAIALDGTRLDVVFGSVPDDGVEYTMVGVLIF